MFMSNVHVHPHHAYLVPLDEELLGDPINPEPVDVQWLSRVGQVRAMDHVL